MKKVHLICNAHIDPIWQWNWQEGASAALSTFRSAADLADEYDYIFCHNEVSLYKYVEEYAPALFERIKALVQAGKWHIMGGWYLQPDCNMPVGESFVRQILKGKEYFTEKFGVFPTTAINFDPFGHSKGIVQIMQKCGQNSYMFMRPYPHEMSLPDAQFIWKGFANSQVTANRVSCYNTALGEARKSIEERAANQKQDVICITWGVGNHGGGPSRKDLSDIAELMASNEEIVYVHSDPERFFAEMRTQAEYDQSLRISMPGCYTSMGRVKRAHIRLENALYQAEKLCAAASIEGLMEYPTQKFNEITEDLLNSEFHDTLPGTCIQSAEANVLDIISHGTIDAERMMTRAFFSLLNKQTQAAEGEYPIFIASTLPYTVEENVECEFSLADQNRSEEIVSQIRLLDQDGNAVPYQLVKEESNLALDWRKRIVFKAKLKPLQLTRYSVYVDFVPVCKKEVSNSLIYDDGRKYVEIDRKTGLLTHYKIDGTEYLSEGVGLVMADDNPDPWAMGVFQLSALGENEQPFALEAEPNGPFSGLSSIQVIEDGDIYLGVEAFFVKDNTRARLLYKIYKNDDAVDIDVTLFMNDVNKIIKLRVPTLAEGTLIGQTAFGEEPLYVDGRENVSLRYVAFKQQDNSFAVINNCIYGSSCNDRVLYLNLVRGASYCAHPIDERPIIPNDRYIKKIDQGINEFSFRLTATKTDKVAQLAQLFNQKPFSVNAYPLQKIDTPAGDNPVLLLDNSAVTLEALKAADCKDGYVIRLLNNTSVKQTATLKSACATLSIDFLGYEVKTVIYKGGSLIESDSLVI